MEIKNLKDLTKEVEEKKPTTVEDALAISKDFVKNIPLIEEKINQIQLARGAIIEVSTHLERLFDEIILKTNKPTMIKDKFMNKARFVRGLMELIHPKNPEFSREFLGKFEKAVAIRNLFAHVPINPFSEKLEFDPSERYKSFYDKLDESFKDVSMSSKYFMEASNEILQKTTLFITLIVEEINRQKEIATEIERLFNEVRQED